jgi:hypothetical protein
MLIDDRRIKSAVNPRLVEAGGGGILNNAEWLDTLVAYRLRKDSPMRDAGLDFNVTWDPYHYANDAVMQAHFNSAPTDFYGDALPKAGSGKLSIGADEGTEDLWWL